MTTLAVPTEAPVTTGRCAGARATHPVQVDAAHYGERYMTLPRFVGCWTQAKLVAAGGPTALEVGIGAGLTAWLLQRWGLTVYSIDLDPALGPSVAADITHLPMADGAVDSVLAAEVLEHLPFDEFVPALCELARVARNRIIVTIPCRTVGISLGVNLPLIEPIFASMGVPWKVRHRFDGQHHWEMGRKGYPRRRIRRHIDEAGLRIVREFRPPLSLFTYGFVLSRQSTTPPSRRITGSNGHG